MTKDKITIIAGEQKWDVEMVRHVCQNCKWWDCGTDKSKDHICMSKKLNYGPDQTGDEKEKAAPHCLGYADYIGLRTGPDFGCIHWEKRE